MHYQSRQTEAALITDIVFAIHYHSTINITDATALSGLSATSQIIAENITCLGNETSTTECNATVPVITPSCFDSFPGRAAGVRCAQGMTI